MSEEIKNAYKFVINNFFWLPIGQIVYQQKETRRIRQEMIKEQDIRQRSVASISAASTIFILQNRLIKLVGYKKSRLIVPIIFTTYMITPEYYNPYIQYSFINKNYFEFLNPLITIFKEKQSKGEKNDIKNQE